MSKENTQTRERRSQRGRWAMAIAIAILGLRLAFQVMAPQVIQAEVEIPAPDPTTTAAAVSSLSPVFTPEVQYWGGKITSWSVLFKLDPNLAATVMQIESCGWRDAVSSAGAQGLFQVMPDHFAPGEDMLDPDTNAARGLAYLALGLQRAGGDAGLALAGYNGGHGVIGLDPSRWSAETQRYWYWGTGIYQDAASGQSQSPRLQEWLQAGGGLCAEAKADEH